ncbi:Hypothetical protein PENO1_078460 [Penicillium occitanis (nom. inval.)]|nr:hypothetical protein PENOC_083810 [Penicillium occitanis (nom. inval.)]PCG94432.1 Hypothetical protein PENO1_078460 [Penicillium occitanis (nom. inval.)]
MDPESRYIGNREGHNLFELLQDLHEQVRELKEQHKHSDEELKEAQKEIEEQQKRIGENDYLLLAAYANELEWTAGKSDAESRYTRNVIIHGGDIRYAIRSIELLEELGEATRVKNASIGFEITYGVSIGKIQPIIATAPEEIVDLLNKRAVLQKLWKWKKVYPKGRKEWIKDCDQAIKTWLLTGGDSYLKEYSRLSQWMAERVDIIKATAS